MNEKYITSLELSKRLKELGVKQESEWYWVWDKISSHPPNVYPILDDKHGWKNSVRDFKDKIEWCSAFHVGELGDMLPQRIEDQEGIPRFLRMFAHVSKIEFYCQYICLLNTTKLLDTKLLDTFGITEAEARGKMLAYLKENKLI